jgi:hypothetical protein
VNSDDLSPDERRIVQGTDLESWNALPHFLYLLSRQHFTTSFRNPGFIVITISSAYYGHTCLGGIVEMAHDREKWTYQRVPPCSKSA